MRSLALLLAIAAAAGFGAAPEAGAQAADGDLFRQAVERYEQKDPVRAELLLRQAIGAGEITTNAYFNLGNAAYRQGRYPMAVLAYEAARELDPGDSGVRRNLELARQHLVVDVVGRSLSPATRSAVLFLRSVPMSVSLGIFVALWSLGWILLLVRLARRHGFGAASGVALLLLSLPAGVHAAWSFHHSAGPELGVLQVEEVGVKSGPGDDYTTLFSLHAGCLVEVVTRRPDWSLIRVPDGPSGWVKSGAAALLFEPSTWPPPPAS